MTRARGKSGATRETSKKKSTPRSIPKKEGGERVAKKTKKKAAKKKVAKKKKTAKKKTTKKKK